MRARYPVVMDSCLSDSGLYGVSPIPIPPFVVKIKKDHICKVVGTFNKSYNQDPVCLPTHSIPTNGRDIQDKVVWLVEGRFTYKCLTFIITCVWKKSRILIEN